LHCWLVNLEVKEQNEKVLGKLLFLKYSKLSGNL
jgi:hypothetical protein